MKFLRNIKLLLLLNIFTFILISNASSQYCQGFHHDPNCRIRDIRGFSQYGQARSAVLEINKKFSYKVIFYSKKDFKVLVCTETGYYPVHYRLINAETKEVFYDNMEDDYVESVGFTTEESIPMIIEVTILAEDIEADDAKDLRICAGIQIMWRKTPKLGF